MDSLKSSLKAKLLDLEFEGSDLEALVKASNDSFISVPQCEAVHTCYSDWVEREFERKKFDIENVPFILAKPEQSLNDIIADDGSSDKLAKESRKAYKQIVVKVHRAIRRQAINDLSQKREMLQLNREELVLLSTLFCEHSENFIVHANKELMRVEDYKISFSGYQTAIKEFFERIKTRREVEFNGVQWSMSDNMWMIKWFTAKLFMQLSKPELDGKVHVSSLMEYVSRRMYNYKIRLDFLEFDADGRGYIRKNQLALYLFQTWPGGNDKLDQNEVLEIRSFIDYLVAEIFFLLDPNKKGCVKSVEILGWKLYPYARKEFLDHSLFNAFKLKEKVYKDLLQKREKLLVDTFCELFPDIALSIWEMDSRLGNKKIRFLKSFMERLVRYPKVTFETFLDITFAWENLGQSFSSIYYFFRALDIQVKGYLEIEDLQSHYKALQEYWRYQENQDEAFDEKISNLKQIQTQIHEFLESKGVSRVTPEILHEIPGGYMVIEYLINAESLSSPPLFPQDQN